MLDFCGRKCRGFSVQRECQKQKQSWEGAAIAWGQERLKRKYQKNSECVVKGLGYQDDWNIVCSFRGSGNLGREVLFANEHSTNI